jgi:uncharacterized protein YndB with AHSA1/START domain
MTTPEPPPAMLVVRRLMPVPRERVFAAWLDPVSLAQWMRPGDEVTHVTSRRDRSN